MDIKKYLNVLDSNTNEVLQLIKKNSNHELSKKEEGKWSSLQIAEHIYLTDKIIVAIISQPTQKKHHDNELMGNEKLQQILLAEQKAKVKAPEILEPKGIINDTSTFERLFSEQRNLIKQAIENAEIVIDNRLHKHPMLGEMTISDWLYFLIHHSQRHLEQIKERLENQTK